MSSAARKAVSPNSASRRGRMQPMTDIFDVLDRAIDELRHKRQPSSREPNAAGTVTGTPNPLKTNPVPVVPAVPVANDDTSAELRSASTIEDRSAIKASESAPNLYLVQNTGSTGSTGTLEESCGSLNSRTQILNGNNGNSSSDNALQEDPISYLSEYGLFIDFE